MHNMQEQDPHQDLASLEPVEPASEASSRQLPGDVLLCILQLLPPNDLACSGRLINKSAAQHLSSKPYCTMALDEPLPPHTSSVPCWTAAAQSALRRVSFARKLALLQAAAASGSKTNLALAWQLICPSLFPELVSWGYPCGDMGVAAVRAGHLHLLPWLLQHRCPLNHARVWEAAAECCDLEGLQEVRRLLEQHGGQGVKGRLRRARAAAIAAAAGSCRRACHTCHATRADTCRHVCSGGDPWVSAQAKVEALLGPRGGGLTRRAFVAAAGAGNLPLLQWMLGRLQQQRQQQQHALFDPDGEMVLAALRSEAAGLEVVHWLLDVAGCAFPNTGNAWDAAGHSGFIPKLEWLLLLHRRSLGASSSSSPPPTDGLNCALMSAARRGHVEAVSFLYLHLGGTLTDCVFTGAAGSGSRAMAEWLLQHGCPTGRMAYLSAARRGDVDIIRWLLHEARCPWGADTVTVVVQHWGLYMHPVGAASRRLAAVQLLLHAGCPHGGEDAIIAAAERGDVQVVRCLHEAGGRVPLGPRAVKAAAVGGCEELLVWLRERQGCAWGDVGQVVAAAGRAGDLGTLRVVVRLGVPMDRDVLPAVVERGCALAVLKLLVEQGGVPAGAAVVERALDRCNHVSAMGRPVVAWLNGLRERQGQGRRRRRCTVP